VIKRSLARDLENSAAKKKSRGPRKEGAKDISRKYTSHDGRTSIHRGYDERKKDACVSEKAGHVSAGTGSDHEKKQR